MVERISEKGKTIGLWRIRESGDIGDEDFLCDLLIDTSLEKTI